MNSQADTSVLRLSLPRPRTLAAEEDEEEYPPIVSLALQFVPDDDFPVLCPILAFEDPDGFCGTLDYMAERRVKSIIGDVLTELGDELSYKPPPVLAAVVPRRQPEYRNSNDEGTKLLPKVSTHSDLALDQPVELPPPMPMSPSSKSIRKKVSDKVAGGRRVDKLRKAIRNASLLSSDTLSNNEASNATPIPPPEPAPVPLAMTEEIQYPSFARIPPTVPEPPSSKACHRCTISAQVGDMTCPGSNTGFHFRRRKVKIVKDAYDFCSFMSK